MSAFKQKPSPALIVSILALFVALVGTAVAGPLAEVSLNKAEKTEIRKISRKIAAKVSDGRITARAPGLSVASAQSANSAGSAQTARSAQTAQSAVDAKQLGGLGSDQYQRRVTGSCAESELVQSIGADGGVACGRSVRLIGVTTKTYHFFINLSDANAATFDMGQVRFEDLGVAGQFRICLTDAGFTSPWVTYLNGVRASGATTCTTTQTVPDALSDFEGTMRRTRWLSAHSGDNNTVRTFNVYAISQF